MRPTVNKDRIPVVREKLRTGNATDIRLFGSSLVDIGSDAGGWATIAFPRITVEPTNLLPNGDFLAGIGNWYTDEGGALSVGVGPAGENAIQFPFPVGGQAYTEVRRTNGAFTVSASFRKTSGAPAVTVILEDKNTMTDRGQVAFSPGSAWETRTVAGTTEGVAPGFKVWIWVTGGTVEMTRASVYATPTAATVANYGISGGDADDTAALLVSHPEYIGGDLAVIGLLPNDGIMQMTAYEGVIAAFRTAGVEVLLVTDNAFLADTAIKGEKDDIWLHGADVKNLATKLGCATADTAGYMRESEWRGVNPYVDNIHQSTAVGHPLWAEAVNGVLDCLPR